MERMDKIENHFEEEAEMYDGSAPSKAWHHLAGWKSLLGRPSQSPISSVASKLVTVR